MTISAIDSGIILCLACSSSLLPRSHESIFETQCCQKPICSSCISANPRLARYNPCLACLGGVQAVGLRRTGGEKGQLVLPENINIDGALRDEDTFVLGDDDDEENLDEESAPPPAYTEQPSSQVSSSPAQAKDSQSTSSQSSSSTTINVKPSAVKQFSGYFIQRGDTVHGIALRFGVDGRELCRLNKLPPSTLSTTPHLLHTRTVLALPASACLRDPNVQDLASCNPSDGIEERLRAARRIRERAEKRLQTMTKEVDWRVAKAYIALAEDEDVEEFRTQYDLKLKEPYGGSTHRNVAGRASNLEMMALDKYFEDDEWEDRERQAGRSSKSSRSPSFKDFRK